MHAHTGIRGAESRHRIGALGIGASVLFSACRSDRTVTTAPVHAIVEPVAAFSASVPAPASLAPASVAPAPAAPAPAAPAPAADVRSSFADWLRGRLPPGGRVVVSDTGTTVSVRHSVSAGDTALTIAKAYVDLTTVYRAKDLAGEIAAAHAPPAPGSEIEIPHLITEPYKSPNDERLRWPPDVALKGVFISGIFAGSFWPETIDKLADRKLNAVVLDAKDYMGTVNYPTRVKLAVDSGAAQDPPIADYSRAIRFAHRRGIHVIARIPCFHDPWAARRIPRLSLMGRNGKPFEMGWIDPANDEAQAYIIDLVREAVDLGADEVQLDYVRFPVQPSGVRDAAMPAADGHRSAAIRAFVRRVHEVTRALRVPLSLDLFGVTATGTASDIEALGQNIGIVGSEAEALSPMVYPSHYARGYSGFDEPGNHPEIIGIGTRAAIEKLKAAGISNTIVRPWLQASSYKTSNYGPQYIRDEIKSAEGNGAVGWLLWDPSNSYWAVWQALPVVVDRTTPGGKNGPTGPTGPTGTDRDPLNGKRDAIR